MSVAQPQSAMPSDKGLTKEFRDSDTYIKYRADILARGINEMWVDQIIWWYISRPDMFTCEAGKKMMSEFDARVASNEDRRGVEEQAKSFAAKFSQLLVNEEDDAKDISAPSSSTLRHDGNNGDGGCDPLCKLPGLDTAGPVDSGPVAAAAAAATADAGVSTAPAAASTSPHPDDFPGFTRPHERRI
jgi:hypothetical protein